MHLHHPDASSSHLFFTPPSSVLLPLRPLVASPCCLVCPLTNCSALPTAPPPPCLPCNPNLSPGNCGISVDLPAPAAATPGLESYAALFAEELGLVLEVDPAKAGAVTSLFNQAGVPCSIIGRSTPDKQVRGEWVRVLIACAGLARVWHTHCTVHCSSKVFASCPVHLTCTAHHTTPLAVS